MSCLDANASAGGSVSPRLAVLTFASSDLLEQCLAFLHYYTRSERVPPADIYAIHTDSSPVLPRCFALLPPRNVVRLPVGTPIPKSLLSLGGAGGHSSAGRRSEVRLPHAEPHRMQSLMRMQQELLGAGYTHTLIVDLDEFVMADPARYASLLDFLRRNPHRRTSAPANAVEVQMVAPDEPRFNWDAAPLLRGQRRMMVRMCGMRKPILSRVRSHFTFSTHNTRDPTFFACSPDKWGSAADCLEEALWLVHMKCVDLEVAPHHAALLADIYRGGGNVSKVNEHLRRRCGHLTDWRRSCHPGPVLGGRDSPDGARCRKPIRLAYTGPEQHLAYPEYIPQWVIERI
ncbi:hypothetical protein AB1Y20_006307 [Prymnesium parvum]|uniref:Glycosyltransferase family 92 protein n=1 Tax=Prymnesium parvum TaxID=97485 RepID=A0AB34J3L7_PRYPA